MTIQIPLLPGKLNPLLGGASFWGHRIALHNIFETLFHRSVQGETHPHLARSAVFEQGGYRVVLSLRDDVRFHDGKPLSSADVKFTLDHLLGARSVNTQLQLQLAVIKTVATPDPHTVVLQLSRRNYLLPATLAQVPILPAHYYRRLGIRSRESSAKPLGSGPYRPMASDGQNDVLMLRRFDSYWGGRPSIDEIHFRSMPDPAGALMALRNGEVDIVASLHPEYYPKQVSSVRFKRGFRLLRLQPHRPRVLLFNVRRQPFKARRVRWAIDHLVDRSSLAKALRGDLARLSHTPLAPTGRWYDENLSARSHDSALASRQLDLGGWTKVGKRRVRQRLGRPLRVRILHAKDDGARRAARALVKELRGIGAASGADEADFGFMKAQLSRGRFDLALVGMALPTDGDLAPFLHSEGQLNYGAYRNPLVDSLLTRLRVTPDGPGRVALGRQLHRALHDDPPLLILYTPIDLMIAQRRVGGLVDNGRWPNLVDLTLERGAHR